MAKSNEPFLWALFGAGGMVAALFIPITLSITSVLLMCNVVSAEKLLGLCRNPLVRL
jgi:fumarate reductase subunit D